MSLTFNYLGSQWQQKGFYTYKVSTVNRNGNKGLFDSPCTSSSSFGITKLQEM